jgi:hypothetical protein
VVAPIGLFYLTGEQTGALVALTLIEPIRALRILPSSALELKTGLGLQQYCWEQKRQLFGADA